MTTSNLCTIKGCTRESAVRDMCRTHYARFYNGRDMIPPIRKHGGIVKYHLEDDEIYEKLCEGELVGTVDTRGYERFRAKVGFVWGHRFVMERILGRKLTTEETVHHKNGVRHDNRPENLELWSGKHPNGARVADQVVWAQQALAKHKPFDVNALCMAN